jgi:hypothetical protein
VDREVMKKLIQAGSVSMILRPRCWFAAMKMDPELVPKLLDDVFRSS